MNTSYGFFLGWSVLIIAFVLSMKFEGTKTIAYFILWLAVVLTLVAHYQELQTIVSGAGLPEPVLSPAEQRGRQQ
jgi:hypothetical protein